MEASSIPNSASNILPPFFVDLNLAHVDDYRTHFFPLFPSNCGFRQSRYCHLAMEDSKFQISDIKFFFSIRDVIFCFLLQNLLSESRIVQRVDDDLVSVLKELRVIQLEMGVNYLAASAVCTVASLLGLQWWTDSALEKIKSDGLITDGNFHSGNANGVVELLLGSQVTVALVANFALNAFILIILSLKTVFFVQLYPSETRKVVERLVNYVVYKFGFTFKVLHFDSC
ncbi:hypothetical protein ACLOJK_005526 [Asimina triloba]